MTLLRYFQEVVYLYGMDWTEHEFDVIKKQLPEQLIGVVTQDRQELLVPAKDLTFVVTVKGKV